MGHSLVQFVAALLLVSCSTASDTIRISPGPNSLAQALEKRPAKIIVEPGDYQGGVTIRSPVSISGSGHVRGQISIEDTKSVVLSGLTISSTSGVDTLLLSKSSTVQIDRIKFLVGPTTRRGLWVSSGSMVANDVHIIGGNQAPLFASDKAKLALTRGVLEGAFGPGLVSNSSTVNIIDVEIKTARGIGVVLSRSNVLLERVTIGASGDLSLGVQGGKVVCRDCQIAESQHGVINITGYKQESADVTFIGGVVEHGSKIGIAVGGSQLRVDRTRFIGKPGPDDGDAIAVQGVAASAVIDKAVIESPAAFGVGFYDHATGSVRAKITKPSLGGIILDAADDVIIHDTTIEGCTGDGIAIMDSLEVTVSETRIEDCSNAGLIAGQESGVTVKTSTLTNNGLYGLAAFGKSTINVETSKISGSRFATYATCSDGSEVIVGSRMKILGQTIRCP